MGRKGTFLTFVLFEKEHSRPREIKSDTLTVVRSIRTEIQEPHRFLNYGPSHFS